MSALTELMTRLNLDPNNPENVEYVKDMLAREERDAAAPAPAPMTPQGTASTFAIPETQPIGQMEPIEAGRTPAQLERDAAAREMARRVKEREEAIAAARSQTPGKWQQFLQGIGEVLGSSAATPGGQASDIAARTRAAEQERIDRALGQIDDRYKIRGEEEERARASTDRERTFTERERADTQYQRTEQEYQDARDPNSAMSKNVAGEMARVLKEVGMDPGLVAGKSAYELQMIADSLGGSIKAAYDAALQKAKHQQALELKRADQANKAPPQTEEQKAIAKGRAERYAAAAEAADKVPAKLQTIDRMIEMLENDEVNTGPIREAVRPDVLKGEAAQEFEKLSGMLQLGKTDQLAGVLSDSDMMLLRNTVANLGTDEDVNLNNLRDARAILEKAVEEYKRQTEYLQKNQTLEGYVSPYLDEAVQGGSKGEKKVVERRQTPDGRTIVMYDDGTKEILE